MRSALKSIGVSLAAALLLLSAATAESQKKPLDGKTFTGTMTQKGKTKADRDTFVFQDGKFRSTACDKYGFAETAYTAAGSDVSTVFEAEAKSPEEGTMRWRGTVKGDTIEGTAVWTKVGQTETTYTFQGTLKK